MRKGKYYRYSLKILYYLSKTERDLLFHLGHRIASLADELIIPKTSFFDVLRQLETLEFITIRRKTQYTDYGYMVAYFENVRLTSDGMKFYVRENDKLSNSHLLY